MTSEMTGAPRYRAMVMVGTNRAKPMREGARPIHRARPRESALTAQASIF